LIGGGAMSKTGDERTGTTVPGSRRDPFLAPRLNAEQLVLLRRYGQERPTAAGQVLFREGDRGYDFIVVLSGAVTVVDHEAGVVRELATEGPGEFLAELNILTGERLFATAVVREPGAVLVVPVDRLQEVIAQDQALSDLIVQTILRRRQWLAQERGWPADRRLTVVTGCPAAAGVRGPEPPAPRLGRPGRRPGGGRCARPPWPEPG
jgi:CRP-like cAMP-binding protein